MHVRTPWYVEIFRVWQANSMQRVTAYNVIQVVAIKRRCGLCVCAHCPFT